MNNKILVIIVVLLLLGGGYYFMVGNKNTTSKEGAAMDIIVDEDPKEAMADEPKGTLEGNAMMEEKGSTTDKDGSMTEEGGDAMMEKSAVKTFEVGGGGFYFDPEEIRVTEGDTVKIVFTNEGGTHDWVIDEFNARTKIIKTGETDEIEFVADQAGNFEYYCSVGDHRERGMVGTLVVEPAL
jgi:plastocyanin